MDVNDIIEMAKNGDFGPPGEGPPGESNQFRPPGPQEAMLPPHLIGVEMPDILPLFPSLVAGYVFDSADQYELNKFVKNYIENNEGSPSNGGVNLTNWFNTSDQNFLDLDEPIVKKFSEFVSKSYETFVKVMHWDLHPDHIVPQCWINKTEKGGFQFKHNHSNSWVSGTYYLDFPEKSSPIRFWNNTTECSSPYFWVNSVEHNPFNSPFHDILPKEGTLLLWKSNLAHETLPNESDSRISISFNIQPKVIDNGNYSIKMTK